MLKAYMVCLPMILRVLEVRRARHIVHMVHNACYLRQDGQIWQDLRVHYDALGGWSHNSLPLSQTLSTN